jgi:hypothetical protein
VRASRAVTLALIRGYQILVSPLLPGGCRFYPSCSEYARQVVERDGALRGGARALRRLARCQPFAAGGLDLP